MKDGSYIYDIEVSWDHRGMPENYWWTMHYIFIGDTTPNPESELINVLNSDGPYATAALDMLLDSLMDSPVETLDSIGARPAGIRDWLCWSLAAHVDGMALDTDAPLSVSGLSENGAAARDKIVEYIADRNEPPKQWRQVYL